jgi:pimeloyl-ACP methyl ester carboxylesterase
MSASRTSSAPIVDTTLGPVECATAGEGPAVLVLHGSPGGGDQAAIMARFLVAAGLRAIMPSRPGYLGTPLGERRTIDQQADLHAALLDALGIEQAGVLSWSGGGPSGFRLAALHPRRVRALVALAAVSGPIAIPADDLSRRLMFGTRVGGWLVRMLAAHAPQQLVSATLDSEGSLDKEQLRQRTEEVFADAGKRRFVLDLGQTVNYVGREDGYANDLDQFAAIDSLQLEQIAAPVLLVHGSADTDVPPDHSARSAAAIPGADLLTLDGGTHLAFYTHPQASEAQARALELLR